MRPPFVSSAVLILSALIGFVCLWACSKLEWPLDKPDDWSALAWRWRMERYPTASLWTQIRAICYTQYSRALTLIRKQA